MDDDIYALAELRGYMASVKREAVGDDLVIAYEGIRMVLRGQKTGRLSSATALQLIDELVSEATRRGKVLD